MADRIKDVNFLSVMNVVRSTGSSEKMSDRERPSTGFRRTASERFTDQQQHQRHD